MPGAEAQLGWETCACAEERPPRVSVTTMQSGAYRSEAGIPTTQPLGFAAWSLRSLIANLVEDWTTPDMGYPGSVRQGEESAVEVRGELW